MRATRIASTLLCSSLTLGMLGVGSASTDAVTLQPFSISPEAAARIHASWVDRTVAAHPRGGWARLKFEPTDTELALMGLPSKKVLLSRRYPRPTMVSPDGRFEEIALRSPNAPAGTLGPTVASFAGAGWFGIRPGALLLLLTGNSIGWCSMAHVYGSPGSYKISTAGHCGKTGDTATVVAALGNRSGVLNPILLDFGKFATSHDNGPGDDWALISIDSPWQSLVSPTMCVWGGPRGMYTKTGSTASVTIPRRNLIPTVSVNPDPFLPQALAHYGHGVGIGAGGTPRLATTISWGTSHFMFSGVIAPGDSGSGANTVLGDTVGANMEAAGIITHIWVDALMRNGIGIMAGTRATQVSATLANGQIVPYPVPVPGAP